MASKYYAVRKGRNVGVYTTWNECQDQVSGYKGAEFKSFKTKEEAESFVGLLKKNNLSDDEVDEITWLLSTAKTTLQEGETNVALNYLHNIADILGIKM